MLTDPSRRRLMMFLACCGALLAASFSRSLFAQSAPKEKTLRVLSYNIHHAEGLDRQLDLNRIAAVIRNSKPDLVALQEVDQHVTRSGHVNQADELARLTEMHVLFGANIPLQGGHYGNAILTRFPIKKSKNHLLTRYNEGEQRGVIIASLDIPGWDEPLRFFATHLDHRRPDDERLASAKKINALFHSGQAPAILAGDLNTVPGSAVMDILETTWNTSQAVEPGWPASSPADQPKRRIDFVLTAPRDAWEVVESRVLDEAVASDHRPVLTVWRLRESQ